MTDSASKNRAFKLLMSLLRGTALVLLGAVLVSAAALYTYLNSSLAADQASRLLTSFLQQNIRIAKIHTSGGTVTLNGIALANPTGAAPGNLLELDTLTISPGWGDLLLGRRSVRLLALSDIRLDLRKNKAGTWNFSDLQKRFSGGKPSGTELFISQLSISNAAIQVNGQGVKGLGLQLSNLSTKGAGTAKLELSFEDAARSRYTLSGSARPGSDPAFDLALNAPALSLKGLAGILDKKLPAQLEGLNGGLRLTANLQSNVLSIAGSLANIRSPYQPPKGTAPLAGTVALAAHYDIARDEGRLDSLKLNVSDLVVAQARGTAVRLRNDRAFDLELGFEPLDLARLAGLLPLVAQQGIKVGGLLAGSTIKLSGNAAQGVTRASGTLQLRNGTFERRGQLYLGGLDSTINLSKVAAGFEVRGRLLVKERSSGALVDFLDAPFAISLSTGMKLISAEMPTLAAGSRGVRVSGRLGYVPAAHNPLTAALRASLEARSVLGLLPDKPDLQFTTGTGTMTLDASGRGVRDFTASSVVRINNLQGKQAGHALGLKNGSLDSQATMGSGKLSISGKAAFESLIRGARNGNARFTYHYADNQAAIENAKLTLDDVSVGMARLTARHSPKETANGVKRLPLLLELSGGEVKKGQSQLSGVSGALRGSIVTDARKTWLDGTADISVARLDWQGATVASPVVHAALSRNEMRGTIGGALLGGALNGTVALDLLRPELPAEFRIGVKGLQLKQAGTFLPRRSTMLLTEGALDAAINGSYSRAKGVAAAIELTGNGISVAGSGGKTVLTGGGVTLSAGVAGTTVTISSAQFKAGEGVALQVKGEIENAFASGRGGRISYTLQRTPLNSLVDPFVNMLPRLIQEATVDGSLASEGSLVLRDGSLLLEGSLQFTDAVIEVESQKLKTGKISGSLPFSLDLAGKKLFNAPDQDSFTRENYPRLLEELRKDNIAGQQLRIGGISFGTITLGEILLNTTASNGVTRINTLRSSLYEGAILGSGFVAIKDGVTYRSDLLINGLSLTRFCETIPKIKGYISGRLDGLISLNGAGKGVAGMTGFTELWVREGAGEKMLVSKTFLQKLSGKQLSGFFFRADRSFDQAEIIADLQDGYLTFDTLDISNTNIFGVRDLSVTVASAQNRIALEHLFDAVKQAAVRGKAAVGDAPPDQAPASPEFKWQE